MRKAKIVLCGGGTAGHIMPHLALIDGLKTIFDEIHYIGSVGGMEKSLMTNLPDVIYHEIVCAKLRRSLSPKNLAIPFKLTQGFFQARKLMKKIRPDVIFSKGGYAAVPVVWAAPKDCKVFIHESDMSLGLANKLCLPKADKVFLTFDNLKLKKGIYTGMPLRSQIYKGNKQKIFDQLKIGRRKVLLVMGGSQGSKKINETLRQIIDKLIIKFDIIHITGKGNIDARYNYQGYHQLEFCKNINDIYAASDIAVSRAGSTAISELVALKKPMLLIPLPKNQSRGDQIQNAKYFNDQGLAKMLLQEDLTPQSLYDNIVSLDAQRQRYIHNMRNIKYPDGRLKILEILSDAIK
ncbi:MAG TPA: UDP-N-acetylglucosamine--N-acetylmuramyl-(pentapeptide) pyrophosphoryl-undecaprenol N-acetylglucosamine transferase [Clostridiales bacterium]|jgi:UDP-N-acetylglucosamine--N-acetylmuramyl-(pentapeptide) pyrophosphoryl-undecaprenol N-acetylglucosamine transferase|nr:UDP-N-acetylglucosamine--N-acetylmuramyl-(pentapeptide) pyrophosphoryl-undecaprenol N-acetylglucosamine transferase [Clostridiales bacterium]